MSTNAQLNRDLRQWLLRVTHGLALEVEVEVKEEISAHYADAVDAYKSKGMPDEKAHQAAMRELGEAKEVAQNLRAAHLTKAQCLAASMASLVYPLAMPLASWLVNRHIFFGWALVLIKLAILLPALYVLGTFTRVNQYRFRLLDLPLNLLIWSVLAGQLARMFNFILFHRAVFYKGGGVYIFSDGMLSSILASIVLFTEFSGGVSMLLFGLRLSKLNGRLAGLRIPLIFAFVLTGTACLGMGLGLVLDTHALIDIASSIRFGSLISLFLLLSLFFYRSGFWKPSSPR